MLSLLWALLRAVVHILIILLAIFAIVFLLTWLGGWNTAENIGRWLFWAGLFVLSFGIFSIGGTRQSAHAYSDLFARSMGHDDARHRAEVMHREISLQFAFPLRFVAAGLLAMAIGQALSG